METPLKMSVVKTKGSKVFSLSLDGLRIGPIECQDGNLNLFPHEYLLYAAFAKEAAESLERMILLSFYTPEAEREADKFAAYKALFANELELIREGKMYDVLHCNQKRQAVYACANDSERAVIDAFIKSQERKPDAPPDQRNPTEGH
jgi:hypothetical protein